MPMIYTSYMNEHEDGKKQNKRNYIRRNRDRLIGLFMSEPENGRMGRTLYIIHAALIAAVYAALTIGLAPISFGQQQLRVAEALAVLPAFTPAAVPGLFVGCAIANTVSFMGLPDLIFGSAATLVSAQLTKIIARATQNRKLLLQAALIPLPAVIINTAVIGAMLTVLADLPFWVAAIGVMTGQILSCYGLGAPLFCLLRGYTKYIGMQNIKKDT